MGYSERYCHICGVSFNVGRIRTQFEPRSNAWLSHRDRDEEYPSFVEAERGTWFDECKRDAGCMLAYREDQVEWREKRQRRQRGQDDRVPTKHNVHNEEDDNHDDQDFVPDMMIMAKLAFDDQFKEVVQDTSTLSRLSELVRNVFGNNIRGVKEDTENFPAAEAVHAALMDDSQTDRLMDYDYQTPPETCSELSGDLEEPSKESSSQSDDRDAIYENFRQSLRRREGTYAVYDPASELMIPLYSPLKSEDKASGSTQGSVTSLEYDGEEGSQAWHARKLDHWLTRKPSSYDHPLKKAVDHDDRDEAWEHIAGPGCLNTRAYRGTHISEQEMRFANTLQCLVQKIHAGRGDWGEEASSVRVWQPEPDDEPWEGEAAWFLTGLCDNMPSRDMDDPDAFPRRQGLKSISAENFCWGPDLNDDDPWYAMPFHPACLEVYKRAATEKHGTFNIDLLGSWWRLTSRYDHFHSYPRAEAVRRGMEQWWQHNLGDEYLAADPLFLPGLEAAISASQAKGHWTCNEKEMKTWNTLPAEIKGYILKNLDTVDIAKASLAIPALRFIATQMIRKKLQDQHPLLWELSGSQPYGKWTGLTAWDLKTVQREFDQREGERQSVLEVLKQEGCEEAHDHFEQQWEQDNEARRKAAFEAVLHEKLPLQVPDDGIELAKFAIALDEASESGRLKGLQNRERIWKDYVTILSEIEELQQKGDILLDGHVRPGASLWEHDP